MAGINDLVKGTVGTLAKDKVSPYLSPAQMDFLTFALNPQAYLLDKGVTAAAKALGYGDEYKDLQSGNTAYKDYYKEVMRNAAGDILPGAIGDFVRATPKASDADLQPSGTYTAWNPNTQSFEEQQSSNPITTGTSTTFDDFMRELNGGDIQTVGPLEEYDQRRLDDEYDFQSSLNDFQSGVVDTTPTRSLSSPTSDTDDLAPTGYTLDTTTGTVVPTTEAAAPVGSTYNADLGMNIPVESFVDYAPSGYTFDADFGMNIPAGPSGGKFEEYFQDYYKRGGQIHRGKR